MSKNHNPPDTYRFNKLREAGGSIRLTLVKAAVENTDIDPTPPRPQLAHIPAGDCVWIAFDIDQFESQLARVQARAALTAELQPEAKIIGEYPVSLRGKLGSAVTLVPKRLADTVDIEVGDQITTIAVAPGLLLFVSKERATDFDVAAAVETIRETLPE